MNETSRKQNNRGKASMRYLLDSNICIYIMKKHPREVIHKFKQHDPGVIGVSTITVSELQYGISKSRKPILNAQRVQEFLAPLEIIPYDEKAAAVYGHIRCQIEEHGKPLGPLDVLIAAHVLSRDLTLITNNEEEFRRINRLKVENWVEVVIE